MEGKMGLEELARLLISERGNANLNEKGQKLKNLLLLLASGVRLAWGGTIYGDNWKFLNKKYLNNTINKLRRQKIVEIVEKGGTAIVILTENGKRKVFEQSVEELKINRPLKWDGKWRLVLYDIYSNKKNIRNRLQKILKGGGFYQLQESVYLHAYPCEKEIEFLRNYLGVDGEVRLVLAERIENDEQFKQYFDVT